MQGGSYAATPLIYCCLWLFSGFLFCFFTPQQYNRIDATGLVWPAELKIFPIRSFTESFLSRNSLCQVFSQGIIARGMGGGSVHSLFGDFVGATKEAHGNTMGEGTNILKPNATC